MMWNSLYDCERIREDLYCFKLFINWNRHSMSYKLVFSISHKVSEYFKIRTKTNSISRTKLKLITETN